MMSIYMVTKTTSYMFFTAMAGKPGAENDQRHSAPAN